MKHLIRIDIAVVLLMFACRDEHRNPEVDASPRVAASTGIARYVDLGPSETPRSQDPWHFEVDVALISLRSIEGSEISQATLATNYAVAVLAPEHPVDPAHVEELLRDVAASFSGDKPAFRADCIGCHVQLQ